MDKLTTPLRPGHRPATLLTALSVAALFALTGCVSTAPKMGEDKGTVSGAAGGGPSTSVRLLISTSHPTSFEARRTFCPRLPIPRESWSAGTTASRVCRSASI